MPENGTEQIWGCSICKTPCDRDVLHCPNCGHTILQKYNVKPGTEQ